MSVSAVPRPSAGNGSTGLPAPYLTSPRVCVACGPLPTYLPPRHIAQVDLELYLLAWLARNPRTLVQHNPAIHGDSAQTKDTVLLSIVSSS